MTTAQQLCPEHVGIRQSTAIRVQCIVGVNGGCLVGAKPVDMKFLTSVTALDDHHRADQLVAVARRESRRHVVEVAPFAPPSQATGACTSRSKAG